MASKAVWNWENISDDFWSVPAEEVYYYLHRWRDRELHRLLDLGCGIGRHSLLFAEHGFQVSAADVSDSGLRRLKEAARKKGVSLLAVMADLTALPFDTGSFDAILAYHSIYHVDTEGMSKAIAEAYRVLRPGGEIFLSLISKSTFSFTDPECQVVDANVRLKRDEEGTVLPHFFMDRDDVLRLFSAFQIIRMRHVQDFYERGASWHYYLHAAKPAS